MSTSSSVAGPSVRSDQKAIRHLAAGAVSGFSSAVCLQPLDLLKTRLQQGGERRGVKRRRVGQVVREVLRDDGLSGLWRGTMPTVVRNVPGVALYFYTLSSLRTRLSQTPYFAMPFQPLTSPSSSSPSSSSSGSAPPSRTSTLVRLSSTGNLIAGAIARTSVGFMLNPITVLKARYESSYHNEYNSMIGALRSLVKTNGVRGLFQGFTATAMRDAPYAGISLVTYEKAKDLGARLLKPEWGVPNALLHSGSGAMAAVLATIITSPADCVKTRMQVNPIEHPTVRKALATIYGDRGLSGFFSGSLLR
ncbi:MAG: hypothetical protein TREMPRED_004554, partial [Tremellales sp. Tagirdzhanova-0007]